MASRKSTPGPPSLNAKQALNAMSLQLADGEQLLQQRQIDPDAYSTWQATTVSFVEESFGRNTEQVRDFQMAGVGPVVIVPGMPYDVQAELREQLTSKVARIRGWVDLFSKKVGLYEVAHPNPSNAGPSEKTMSEGGTKIFISHSSEDVEVASKLVDVIHAYLQVPKGALLCTSVAGHRLTPGDDAPNVLRAKLKESKIVICLITPTSLASSYVLMELGAAWGFEACAVPALARGIFFRSLPGFFSDIHAVRLTEQTDVLELCETVHQRSGLPLTGNMSKTLVVINELMKIASVPGGAPAQAAPFRG